MKRMIWFVAVLAVVGLTGCSTVDFDFPKSESYAFTDTDDTRMGQRSAPLVVEHPGESGFHLQNDGIEALATRLRLATRAQRSIDAQYYLISSDLTGRLFIDFLLEAADRGVRVRLLLDDIQTQGYDVGMVALNSHPNFEIRIWNPFARGGNRLLRNAGSFSRVNRRMHNKTFTVDNRITIIGGRNIADEYFGAHEDANFGDLDAVAVGPVVQDVSRQFDTYWNDQYAVPVPGFADRIEDPEAALNKLRQRLAQSREEAKASRYAEVFAAALASVDQVNEDEFVWAPCELVYDSPAKSRGEELEADEAIVTPLREAVLNAEREIVIVSPYFVPRKNGEALLLGIRDRGIDVKVVTNSLASTNHSIVHTGYAPSRKPLLKGGVKLYEYRADRASGGAQNWEGGRGSEGNLHTKAFLVDRKVFFLGSFNMDPRSVLINTELGVIIDSHEIGAAMGTAADEGLLSSTYQVTLSENGGLRWTGYDDNGEPFVLDKEPNTTWWERTSTNLMRLLPVKGQL
jgi:putative cardiolipin synthase